MSMKETANPTRLRSVTETKVALALQHLPSNYIVIADPELMTIDSDSISARYEPDFVVHAPDGRRLIIEVKSRYSLSLSNIARFSAIGRFAKKEGAVFLVLVLDADKNFLSETLNQRTKGFRISFARESADVVRAVLDALDAAQSA
jgi:hypothetical protein